MSDKAFAMYGGDSDSDDDGTGLFEANADNKALEAKVKKAEKRLLQVEGDLELQLSRLKAMKDHMQNVEQEVNHTQALVDVRQREKTQEANLAKMTKQGEVRLRRELKKVNAEIKRLGEEVNSNQNNIFRSKQRLEEIKEDMQWNESAMEQWVEQTKVIDEDAETLEKYTRADDSRIKELTLQIDKLTVKRDKALKDVNNQLMETQAQRIGLDKASEEYQNLHREQQEIANMWQEVIEKMEARDNEITQEAEKFGLLRKQVAEKEAIVRDKEEFFKEQQKTNQETRQDVDASERLMLQTRQRQLQEEKRLTQFKDELQSVRTTLAKTSQDLSSKTAEVKQLKRQLQDRHAKCASLEVQIGDLDAEIKVLQKKSLSAEEREAELAKMLEVEQQDLKGVMKEIDVMRKHEFKVKEELNALDRNCVAMEKEIGNLRNSNANTESRIRTLEAEITKQGQVKYQQEFKLSQLDRKIQKLEGKQSTEEKEVFDAQIKELKAELEEQKKVGKLITSQIVAIEDQLRVVARRSDTISDAIARDAEQVQRLELQNKSMASEIKALAKRKQDLSVEENILQLEIRRVRQALNDRADRVYGLEHRQVQLKHTMAERMGEIKIHKEMLTKQSREIEADITSVRKEMNDRFGRIDQLKKRYEIIMMMMDTDEDGKPRSQAYYLVKHAQEREELQREGDTLQEAIDEEERQLRGLQKTLMKMTKRNTKYKTTLRQSTTGQQAAEQEDLEKTLRTLLANHKMLIKQKHEIGLELKALEEADFASAQEEQALTEDMRRRQREMDKLEEDLGTQQQKLVRARGDGERLLAQHNAREKKSGTGSDVTNEFKDYLLRTLREGVGKALDGIEGVASAHPDIGIQINMLYAQNGIKRPSRSIAASRAGSSFSGSQRSRTSSRVSSRGHTRTVLPTVNDVVAKYSAQGKPLSAKTYDFGLPSSQSHGSLGPVNASTSAHGNLRRSTATGTATGQSSRPLSSSSRPAHSRQSNRSSTVSSANKRGPASSKAAGTRGKSRAGTGGNRASSKDGGENAMVGGLSGLSISGSRPVSAARSVRSNASTSSQRKARIYG